jgi:hypothetical protein
MARELQGLRVVCDGPHTASAREKEGRYMCSERGAARITFGTTRLALTETLLPAVGDIDCTT